MPSDICADQAASQSAWAECMSCKEIRQYCAGTCLLDSCLRSCVGRCMQSNIDAEGFRSLRENEAVEFFVEEGEDGRTKAVNVTGPDGAPPQVWAYS